MKRLTVSLSLILIVIPSALVGQASGRSLAAGETGAQFLHACGAVHAGLARCNAIVAVRPDRARVHPTPTLAPTSGTGGGGGSYPNCSSNLWNGYTPCDLQSAYNLPVSTAGSGQTVAIVDAYDAPSAEADLGVYRSQWHLPPCTTANGCFRKDDQNGGSSYPGANGGWAQEISLDLDMVSAICPNCHILLVEASSNSLADLFTAEDYATSQANYLSNSWSSGEFSGESSYDFHFQRAGKIYVFATGDGGYGAGPQYPATSPYVTAAGGTSLNRASNSRGWTESAWSGAGSGCSGSEAQPSWQSSLSSITTSCARNRAEADASAVADPNTGVNVYDSYAYQGLSGWLVIGGTSVATPILTSVYALAGNPTIVVPAATSGPSWVYGNSNSLFDITSGSNSTSCGNDLCTATLGWDGPTGLGTPNGVGAF